MINIEVPGMKIYLLENMILDFNGTIAVQGKLIPGVREMLVTLSQLVEIHIVTADTFGTTRTELDGIPCLIATLRK